MSFYSIQRWSIAVHNRCSYLFIDCCQIQSSNTGYIRTFVTLVRRVHDNLLNLLFYRVSKRDDIFIFNNSVENEPLLVIFGMYLKRLKISDN